MLVFDGFFLAFFILFFSSVAIWKKKKKNNFFGFCFFGLFFFVFRRWKVTYIPTPRNSPQIYYIFIDGPQVCFTYFFKSYLCPVHIYLTLIDWNQIHWNYTTYCCSGEHIQFGNNSKTLVIIPWAYPFFNSIAFFFFFKIGAKPFTYVLFLCNRSNRCNHFPL